MKTAITPLLVETYKTPQGYLDFPYFYVFDATQLVNGQTYLNLPIQIQGDADFVCRRVTGIRTVLPANGLYQIYSGGGGQWFQAPCYASSASRTALPERIYPYDSAITFDLYNVLRATGPASLLTPAAYLAFQGVKRFRVPVSPGIPSGITPYRYREAKYTYQATIAVPPAGGAPSVFTVELHNRDFELERISITNTATGVALATIDFLIMLQDSNGHNFSNIPLNPDFLNNAFARWPVVKSVFPVPPVVYPAGGAIRFEITSLLFPAGAQYDFSFDGIERVPW